MIQETYDDYFKVVDPSKKDAKWANKCIQAVRRNWTPYKSIDTMRHNKQLIFAQNQDMIDRIKKTFKDKAFLKDTKFQPLGTWPVILNVIIEELLKAPPKAELRANDNTALTDKDYDSNLLRLKPVHEKIMNSESEKIGEPPSMIGNDKFKTNIEQFFRMNLDPNDPEDIDFYERNDFPRLKYEIAGQKIINEVMKLNRFDKELVRDGVIDVLSGNGFFVHPYVNKVTGEIIYDRIYLEEAYGVWGTKRDGSDDISQGWLKNQTVSEWLGRVGNDFSFEKDWAMLLWAINYTNQTKFTGFRRFGNVYDCWSNESLMSNADANYNGATESNVMDYSMAFAYNIYTGYIRWESPEVTATYLAKNGTGELTTRQVPFDYFLDTKDEVKEYYKESFYQWQQYESYFLPTSGTSQWIYGWGKVYYMTLEGAYDQYCKTNTIYYRLEGQSAAELTEPYVEFANLCFYRLKWMVYHAKPQKEQYVIEELIKVSKAFQKLYPQNAGSAAPTIDNILTQLIEFKRANFVDVRSFPEIEGKTYPVLPPQEGAKSAPDQLALWLQATEQWLEMQIREKVGLNDMRLGQIDNAREGYKKGLQETQASINSTGYVYRVIQMVKEHCAITTLNYSQDIVKFKDTIPYKYLNNLLGKDEMENAKLLKDFSVHRYALTIDDLNIQFERERLVQAADMALNKEDGKGGIDITEWGILMQAQDPKDGFKKLALFKYKAQKRQRAYEAQVKQVDHQNSMELEQSIQAAEKAKGDVVLRKAAIDAASAKYTADRGYASKVDVKTLTNESEAPKQASKADAEKDVLKEKSNLEAQKPLTV